MKKNKRLSPKKMRLMIFGSLSILIILYTSFYLLSYVLEMKKLTDTEQRLNNQLVELKNEGEHLKTEIKKLKDPDYLARYARENYLYSKEDEYIIKISKDQEQEKSEEDKSQKNGLLIYGSLGLSIAVVVIYILTKKR